MAYRWLLTGMVFGSALSGVVLWPLLYPARVAAPFPAKAAALWILYSIALLINLGDGSHVLPQRRRQIPRAVLSMGGPRLGPLQFGFELGTGVRTYLPTALPHVAALMVGLLSPSWLWCVAASVGFGVGRSLLPLARILNRRGNAERIEQLVLSPALSFTMFAVVLLGIALLRSWPALNMPWPALLAM